MITHTWIVCERFSLNNGMECRVKQTNINHQMQFSNSSPVRNPACNTMPATANSGRKMLISEVYRSFSFTPTCLTYTHASYPAGKEKKSKSAQVNQTNPSIQIPSRSFYFFQSHRRVLVHISLPLRHHPDHVLFLVFSKSYQISFSSPYE